MVNNGLLLLVRIILNTMARTTIRLPLLPSSSLSLPLSPRSLPPPRVSLSHTLLLPSAGSLGSSAAFSHLIISPPVSFLRVFCCSFAL